LVVNLVQNTHPKIAHALQKFRIFEHTPASELDKIAKILSMREYARGDVIITKGDEGETMFFIDSGSVVVMDEHIELSRLQEGDVFGEYSLIDTQTRSATVKAVEHTRLYKLHQKDFIDLVMSDMAIMRGFLNVFVSRLRDQDVLQQKLQLKNTEISKKNEALEKLNAEKDQLMRILAHDIRNPLNSAMNLTEVLREDIENLDSEHEDCFEMISSSLRRINVLVENMLRGHVLDKHHVSAKIEDVSVCDVLQDAILNFTTQIRDKALSVDSTIDELSIPTDKYFLRQIYDNLLSNAVKYSPRSGKVTIRLYHDGNEVFTEFRDEGQGLTPDDQEKLFREFQTLSARPTAGESSFGLGLSIVKKFTEKLGGRVWCESEHGKGACFTLALPLKSPGQSGR
jgi:signal transduction histidine kinase